MALINCPECKKEISSHAKMCVHCGYPIEDYYKMLNFKQIDDNSVELESLNSKEITDLIIPKTDSNGIIVTKIGNAAFYNCSNLKSVEISDTIKSIGDNAFYGCLNLEKIYVSNSVERIGEYAFYLCDSLKSVYINNLENWCNIEFFDTTSNPLWMGAKLYLRKELVTNLVIPTSISEIKDYTFYMCSSLASLEIPDSVTSIGIDAFAFCSNLSRINIGKGVKNIEYGAFERCDSLTSLTIPFIGNKLNGTEDTYLGFVFGAIDCYTNYVPQSLKTIVITGGSTIDEYAFNNCKDITSIEIPNTIKSIGRNAFAYCSSLLDIKIPNSVTSIGSCAFTSCSSLTSIEIPDSVTSIGNQAFAYCSSLTSIKIPESVINMGEGVFEGCVSLKK